MGNEFTINCDHCHSWYHGSCVGLSRETVPNEWLCDACQLNRVVEFETDRNTNMGGIGNEVDESYSMRRLLIDYLSIVSRQSGIVGANDAYEFQLARWVLQLKQLDKKQQAAVNGSNGSSKNTHAMMTRLLELWDPRESSELSTTRNLRSLSGMLHCISDEGRSRMVVHLVAKHSLLVESFRIQIGLVVKIMGVESSAMLRKLSVKVIEKVSSNATDASISCIHIFEYSN